MSKNSIIYILSVFLVSTVVLLDPGAAGAQPTQTLVQDDLESNVLIAPDFKLTDLGGDLTGLAGLHGGWLINQRLLIGGGGYFQINDGGVSDMKYGGAVLEYFVNPSRLLHVSVRGLLGGGTATLRPLSGRFPILNGFASPDFSGIDVDRRFAGRPVRFNNPRELDETFFVAEPEANVTLNVTESFRIGFGGGYRFIGEANGFENSLEGFTANLAAQFRF